MVAEMKQIAAMAIEQELSVEERNLLSVAYKNLVGARRASWRILQSVEQSEQAKGNEKRVKLIQKYRTVVEKELDEICGEILDLLDKYLVPSATTCEASVFYLKVRGHVGRRAACGRFACGRPRAGPGRGLWAARGMGAHLTGSVAVGLPAAGVEHTRAHLDWATHPVRRTQPGAHGDPCMGTPAVGKGVVPHQLAVLRNGSWSDAKLGRLGVRVGVVLSPARGRRGQRAALGGPSLLP
jgi:hypothetical protein